MKNYPPLDNNVSPARLARRVDRLCDRFEAGWKKGRRPQLERYLTNVPLVAQPDLLRELLILELEYRAQEGERPEPEEYHRRFPAHVELINAVFREARQATPSNPYLLRKWAATRLASQMRMLTAPHDAQSLDQAGAISLMARILSRTAGEKGSGVFSEKAPAPFSSPERPTKLLQPGNGDLVTAAEAETKVDIARPALRILGDYELLNELGRGGMGIVYRARQRSTNRIVALKVIRSDQLALLTADERQEWFERFRREGQMAACLEHDHLVTVHEVGRIAGEHFYSMRYVDGQSLAEILRTGPIANRPAAYYLEQVARAVHALHLRGIVHRDLKPRNILVDASDRPFLTDFGLAKWSEYARDLTQPGACVGTPEYMAPEQAFNPAAVNAASDIYSLGATLYEMLTGRPPFRAADPLETLRQVRDEDPPSPRRLNPAVHRDLELICLKCLQKEPPKRYASALEVAEELHRYGCSEPLQHTRAVTKAERLWRWCRRKPALAVASSLALVATIATIAVSLGFAIYQSDVVRKKQLQLAESTFNAGLSLLKQGEAGEGLLRLVKSLEMAPPDAHHLKWLNRINLAAWGRTLSPLREMLPHEEEVLSVAFCQDGRSIFTATSTGAQLWETATGRPISESIAFQGHVTAAAISTDGSLIVAGNQDGTGRLYNAATGQPVGRPLKHEKRIGAVAFSVDRKKILTGSDDDTAQLWDAGNGVPIGPRLPHKSPVWSVAFSPDGRTAVTGSQSLSNAIHGEIRLWEVDTGKRAHPAFLHKGTVNAVAYSPDGKTFAVACNKEVRIWSALTGQPVGEPARHQTRVTAVAFSPDGSAILTGCADKTALIWEINLGRPVRLPLQHRGEVTSLGFSPDGKFILTGSSDKIARLWEAAPKEFYRFSLTPRRTLYDAGFSQDGKKVATASADGVAQVWDVATGKPLGPAFPHQGLVRAVAFSPDSHKLLTGSWDKTAKLWDLAAGQLLHELPNPSAIWAVAFSPDGNTVVTGSADGMAQVWDVRSGKCLAELKHGATVFSAAYSRDGKKIVTASGDHTAKVWSTTTWQPIGRPLQHQGAVFIAVFSHDSRFVVTGSRDETAQVWNASTGESIGPGLHHNGGIEDVAFSPDDNLVLTGSHDQTARLWETSTGHPRSNPLPHRGIVRCVAFSPDGRLAITGGEDNTARVWDVATGRPVGPPLHNPGMVHRAFFSPDDHTILTASPQAALLWEMPEPLQDGVERLAESLRVMTGMELDETDTAQVMDYQEWKRTREHLKERAGLPGA